MNILLGIYLIGCLAALVMVLKSYKEIFGCYHKLNIYAILGCSLSWIWFAFFYVGLKSHREVKKIWGDAND